MPRVPHVSREVTQTTKSDFVDHVMMRGQAGERCSRDSNKSHTMVMPISYSTNTEFPVLEKNMTTFPEPLLSPLGKSTRETARFCPIRESKSAPRVASAERRRLGVESAELSLTARSTSRVSARRPGTKRPPRFARLGKLDSRQSREKVPSTRKVRETRGGRIARARWTIASGHVASWRWRLSVGRSSSRKRPNGARWRRRSWCVSPPAPTDSSVNAHSPQLPFPSSPTSHPLITPFP